MAAPDYSWTQGLAQMLGSGSGSGNQASNASPYGGAAQIVQALLGNTGGHTTALTGTSPNPSPQTTLANPYGGAPVTNPFTAIFTPPPSQ